MIDRKKKPDIQQIDSIDFPNPGRIKLANGTEVWEIWGGSQELTKIDFIFNAGAWYQPANLVAGLTNAFLNQGTPYSTAQQIAEAFDFTGAYLQLSADQQLGYVGILTLNKYLDKILDKTREILENPVFPESEIAAQIIKRRQQFMVENSKVKVLAHKKFSQVLYGENHPYANTNYLADYDRLTRDQFIKFHAENYLGRPFRIILSGNYPEKAIKMLEQCFGTFGNVRQQQFNETIYSVSPDEKREHFVLKEGALQSAIRIGRIVPNRDHPDFMGLAVLSTLLGGYFGSRLMSNLREEKGFTYGIGAALFTLKNSAWFSVMTETGAEVSRDALHEIYREIDRLRNKPVGKAELNMVRNYMLGDLSRSIDGVLTTSESLKGLLENDLDFEHFARLLETIKTITPRQIQNLANSYFMKDDLFEVVAGAG